MDNIFFCRFAKINYNHSVVGECISQGGEKYLNKSLEEISVITSEIEICGANLTLNIEKFADLKDIDCRDLGSGPAHKKSADCDFRNI